MTIPMAVPQSISEPRRDTPVLGAFDVVVLVLGVADDLLARMRALSGDMDNLLVAGRCASMTHMGQSAARVSGACFVMGQAAGSAAAMACDAHIAPRALDVRRLQDRLRADGVWLGDTP